MRSDSIGLFWQDIPMKRGSAARVMPPIPDTGWETPKEFPNLAAAKALCIDVETFDPELKKNGPGWARGVGHIVGVAVGVPEGRSWYFPMRHEVEKEENMDPARVMAWVRDTVGDNRPKVGANLMYDIGWLRQEGAPVSGPLFDVQYAEALLDELAEVNLDALGEKYCGVGKTTNELYDWCLRFYGGGKDQRKNIYRAPPRLVGPYAEGDVTLPFQVMNHQWPLLEEQGLMDVFTMENALTYLLVEMRFAGVTVDLDEAERLRDKLLRELEEIDNLIKNLVGFEVNTFAAESMADAFNVFGLPYGFTPKGKPSFTKGFLETVDHDLARFVLKKKARQKLLGTFVEGYILNSHVNGKVYGSFHTLKGDENGAASGRLSSSNPNLQNIPFRSKVGKVIRNVFVPDPDHVAWRKYDYSQIEYRALAHYAVGPRSDDLRLRYNNEPDVDFHQMVKEIIQHVTGLELERSIVKNINFGSTYGMGATKLQSYLNLPPAKAKELMEEIHRAAPFLRATMDATSAEAGALGYITTILGRRSRFDLWEPKGFHPDATPLRFEEAIYVYRDLQRAMLHKSLNRRLQGSAADLMKKAMLDCWEGGIFDEVGVPRLTVHDELDFSDPGGKDAAFIEMRRVMERAVTFNVPVIADGEIGPSWGQLEDIPRTP